MRRALLCLLTATALCALGTAQSTVGYALNQAFSRAGNSIREHTSASSRSQTSTTAPVKPKTIVVKRSAPRTANARRTKPNPKTTFVLANGERFYSDQYTIAAGVLQATVNGQQRTIPVSTLDMKTTLAVNRTRGVQLRVPQSSREVFLAF